MPRPSKDPLFPWEYSFVEDDGFDDGRTPRAATLMCQGVPFPTVVHNVARPRVAEYQSGPWWLGQDAAVGHTSFAENVLKLAVLDGMVPILSRIQLAAAPDVEVIAVRTIRLPVYADHEQLGHRLVRVAREQIRRLTAEAHTGRGEELLQDLAATLDDLRDVHPGGSERTVSIGLARFPYRPWREGPRAERVHPIIIKTASPVQPPEDCTDGAAPFMEYDGDLQHPTERLLSQLAAGDASGLRAWLRAPATTADRAFGMGGMLRARGKLKRSQAADEDRDNTQLDDPISNNEPLIEEAWRRADELGSADGAYELAALLYARGDVGEAEAAAARADDRGSASGAFLFGELLDRRGDSAAAEAAYRRGDERGNRWAAFNLGVSLKQRGLDDDAAAALARADERGDPRAPMLLGMRMRDAGDVDGAAAAFRRADERGDGPAAYLLGLAAKERGDEIGAEASWRRADARGEPHSATALGIQHAARNDLDAAEAAFARGDERGDGTAAFLRGRLLQQRGQENEAEAAYERATERGIAEAANHLGAQRYAAGDGPGAEAAWRRASELGSVEGSFNLAHELVDQGRINEALPLLRNAALSKNPDVYPRAAFVLGSLFARVGRHEEAQSVLKLALQSGHPEIAPMAAAALAQSNENQGEGTPG